MLIPTIDTDLFVLSGNTHVFGNTKVLISKPDKISICRDKNSTVEFFESCGCKTPKTVNDWKQYQGSYPCFIKPKNGSSSINAFRVESVTELEVYARQVADYIIQPFIKGTEYTVDIFCDFNGNPIYIIPRIRLQIRAGEVLKTQIDMDKKIIEECKRIIEKFTPVVKKAFSSFVNEIVNNKISSALSKDSEEETSIASEVTVTEEPTSKIITTEEELEAFYIIRGLLAGSVPVEDVVHRDTESYFGILYKDNNRKPICRLNLDRKNKQLFIPDENKKFTKYIIEDLNDIYKYKDLLIESVKKYL